MVLRLSEAVSAKEEGRPVFNELVRKVLSGEVDGIIAWHPDRLSRNETDAAVLTKLLRKGILKDLRFANYHFDNSPEGIMMLQIALSQSQYYSSKLARDVKRGMESKVRKGWFPHRAPPGYVNDRHKEQGEKTISPHPEHFALMRRAFAFVRSRQYSVPEVLDLLNGAWGYRSPMTKRGGGGKMSKTTFYRALSNPFYYGCFIEGGALHPGAHPPMVSRAEFEEVQRAIGKGPKAKPHRHAFAYTGLVSCANCGRQVTAQVNRKLDGRSYTYYHCQDPTGHCGKGSIREDRLEAEIGRMVEKVAILPEFAEWAREEIEKWGRGERKADEVAVTQRREVLAEVEKKLDRLLGMRMRELLTDEEYLRHKAQLLSERTRLERAEAEAREREEHARAAMEDMRVLLTNAKGWLSGEDMKAKRAVARAVGSNYRLDRGRLLVEPVPTLLPVYESYKDLEGKYLGIKLDGTLSESTKKGLLEPVRVAWSRMWNHVQQNCTGENPRHAGCMAAGGDTTLIAG